jgi:hypothetical protein
MARSLSCAGMLATLWHHVRFMTKLPSPDKPVRDSNQRVPGVIEHLHIVQGL